MSRQVWVWACVWDASGRMFASDLNWTRADAVRFGQLAAGSSAWSVRRVLVWVAS
jgi:hypothetical protein